MKIIKLNAATDAHFAQMVTLDKKIFERYGAIYADDAWEMTHFRLPLPQKMDWSCVAIDDITNGVIGFCIVSEKHGGIYIHRFIAQKQLDHNLPHIGDALLNNLIVEFKIKPFILLVSTLNTAAISFYEKHGFSIFTYEPGIQALMDNTQINHISRGKEIGTKWRYLMFRRVNDFKFFDKKMDLNAN